MSNRKAQKQLISRLNHKIEKAAEENARYYSDMFNKFKLFILNNIDEHFDESANFEYKMFVSYYTISDFVYYEGWGSQSGSFLKKKINMNGMKFEKFMYIWTKVALKDIKKFSVAKPVPTLDGRYCIFISLDMNAASSSSASNEIPAEDS